MSVAPPSPSSTVVLLRQPVTSRPPEVLLQERHARAAFGGAWVFPGGRVDDGDRDPMWEETALGQKDLAGSWPGADAPWLRDHAVAAVREVFEETGLLFTDRVVDVKEGREVIGPGPGRLGEERRLLLDGLVSFAEVCRKRRWRLRLDRLVPFVRWITPETERRRFDTVFFAAEAPVAPPEKHETHEAEVASQAWITAREALARFDRGEMPFAPPTIRTLEDLAGFGSVDEVLAWARAVPRLVIEPKAHQDGDARLILLPGDPLYPVPVTGAVRPPTRFAFEQGRWTPVR